MLFLRPNSKICILQRMVEFLASSRLLRTSRLSTVFPVPYHLSTVHLVLTAKWLAPRVVASKPHAEEPSNRPYRRDRALFGRSRRSSLRADLIAGGTPRRVRSRPTE